MHCAKGSLASEKDRRTAGLMMRDRSPPRPGKALNKMRIAAAAAVLLLAGSAVYGANAATQDRCGWIGAQVSPITAPFAASLKMANPYGAIFSRPEPGGPAAGAGIQEGDVVTAIDGQPIEQARDFANMISMMAPGTTVYLDALRNGEAIQFKVILGSGPCATSQ
jgi:predicted metalloprotease with PDZ domain